MDLSEALEILQKKPVLGEYGAFNRPFVILDIDEFNSLLDVMRAAGEKPKRRVPREQVRAG